MEWSTDAATDSSKMPLTGGVFSGDVTFTGDSANIVFDKSDSALEFAANAKAAFGGSSELQIFFDGNHSRIYNSTGNLSFKSAAYILNNAAGDENIATFTENGSCNLYYQNDLKLFTKSTGAEVTTTGAVANFVVRGKEGYGAALTLASDDGDDPGDYARILQHTDENLYFQVYNAANNAYEDAIVAKHDNQVELYFDGGSPKFETTSTGAKITSSGTSHGLNIIHSNGNTVAALAHGGSGDEGVLSLRDSNTATVIIRGEVGQDIDITTGANFDLEHDSAKLRFGADNDLEVFNNGSHSYVNSTTDGQNLYLSTVNGQISLQPVYGQDHGILVKPNNAVELYYDGGSAKFETTSTGATAHGALRVYDGSSALFRLETPGIIAIAHTWNGTDYTIANNDGSAGHPIIFGSKTAGVESMRLDASGNAIFAGSLTVDTDTLHVDATNNKVGVGTTSPNRTLSVKSNGGQFSIIDDDDSKLQVYCNAGVGSLFATGGSGIAGSLNFYTTPSGGSSLERMNIQSDGDIEVGGNLKTNNLAGRNILYNGSMICSQRGTSFSFAHDGTTTAFTTDRYKFFTTGLDAFDCTVSQDSTVPDGQGFSKSLKVLTGTAEPGAGSEERVEVWQKLEGQDLQHLAYGSSSAKKITVSFWVRSSITGTFGFSIYRNETSGDRIVNKPYTISAANTWEKKTCTIDGDTVRAVTNDTGNRARLVWFLLAGTDFTSGGAQSSYTVYAGGSYAGGHAQNGVATTAGATWYITGIQLEIGSIATEFDHKSYGEELAKCQRYFQLIGNSCMMCGTTNGSTQIANIGVPLARSMRAAPTTPSQAYAAWDDTGNGSCTTAMTISAPDPNCAIYAGSVTGFSGFTDNRVAVLSPNDATIKLSAEL